MSLTERFLLAGWALTLLALAIATDSLAILVVTLVILPTIVALVTGYPKHQVR